MPKDTEDLFEAGLEKALAANAPLAARLRPSRLEEFVGQERLLAPGRPLRGILESRMLVSLVFWGPPGTGKTTLARIIAANADAEFEEYSAVTSQVADIRRVVEAAKKRLAQFGRRTVLFVDEFHRFNKAQQDAFLPHLENGLIALIGATTENPYFALNPALRSRVTIHHFESLGEGDLTRALRRGRDDLEGRGLAKEGRIGDDALAEIVNLASGDARVALGLLETVAGLAGGAGGTVDPALVREAAGRKASDYGRLGTRRFDMVSAFIKSLRGGNPDAALYWMARLLDGGEDPAFLARRMTIFAGEDIGAAQPNALVVAAAAVQAVVFVGMPEAELPLSSCCVYLACCPKSNAAYKALGEAKKAVSDNPPFPVPLHLRNQDYTREKTKSDGYKYPHDHPGGFIEQAYFPPELEGSVFYRPAGEGHEKEILKRLDGWRERLRKWREKNGGG